MHSSDDLLNKYRKALDNAGMGLWELDLATFTLSWDIGYCRLYELEPGRTGGTMDEFLNSIHTDDLPRVHDYIKTHINENQEVNVHFRVHVKDNRIKFIRSNAYRVYTGGKLTGFVGISWDDTAESLLQNEFQAAKKFNEAILESLPDPLFLKNENSQVVFANREYEKFVGMKREVFVGKSDYDFFPKEAADRFRRQDNEAFSSAQPVQNEEVVVDSRGRPRNVLTKKTPLDIPGKERVLIGIVRDITDLKHIQTSLVAQSKMASLGEMAAGIAHEINNPLSIIRGRALLIKGRSTDEKINSDLELIEQNCIRIEKIMRSLKSVSRNSSLDPFEETPIMAILEETDIIAKERFHDRNLELIFQIAPGISEMDRTRARPAEIVQVLVNLLNNSFDAIRTQKGGWAKIGVSVEAKNFVIEVTDSGARIDAAVAEKMMEPFFTTKPTGKGTGLGLSVSRQFIENHGSKLQYDPKHSHTRFFFTLPKL
jgi:PAS domain S-box-containing protein